MVAPPGLAQIDAVLGDASGAARAAVLLPVARSMASSHAWRSRLLQVLADVEEASVQAGR